MKPKTPAEAADSRSDQPAPATSQPTPAASQPAPATSQPAPAASQPAKDAFNLHEATAPDWRIWLGLGLTVGWLALMSIYIGVTVGWGQLAQAPMDLMGSFLEGAFAPLAFLWLVIGYFLQKKEISQNTAAIKMQHAEIQKSAEQAVIQSEAIQASEQHARKQSFLQIADAVRRQLGGIAGFLFLSSQGNRDGSGITPETLAEMWSKLHSTDPEGFTRSLLQLRFMHGENYAYKLLYGTPIRTRHSESFIFYFERLLKAATNCDEDGMLKDALLGTAHGRMYIWMKEAQATPPPNFTYATYNFNPDSLD